MVATPVSDRQDQAYVPVENAIHAILGPYGLPLWVRVKLVTFEARAGGDSAGHWLEASLGLPPYGWGALCPHVPIISEVLAAVRALEEWGVPEETLVLLCMRGRILTLTMNTRSVCLAFLPHEKSRAVQDVEWVLDEIARDMGCWLPIYVHEPYYAGPCFVVSSYAYGRACHGLLHLYGATQNVA